MRGRLFPEYQNILLLYHVVQSKYYLVHVLFQIKSELLAVFYGLVHGSDLLALDCRVAYYNDTMLAFLQNPVHLLIATFYVFVVQLHLLLACSSNPYEIVSYTFQIIAQGLRS